jgi:putative RNA 2'-phosphotransferase
MKNDLKSKSKYLSLLLRHKPEVANLTMDEEGWVNVKELCQKTNLTLTELTQIVESNDKQRFVFDNVAKTRIRANQGHSVSIKEIFEKVVPPNVLYHGTPKESVGIIFAQGLDKMKRHHVHLSKDIETATKVAARRGEPRIFKIDAERMHQDGYEFFISANGVFLTDKVPMQYLTLLS